jgi:hypothetical protein
MLNRRSCAIQNIFFSLVENTRGESLCAVLSSHNCRIAAIASDKIAHVRWIHAKILPELFSEVSHMRKADLLGNILMRKIGFHQQYRALSIFYFAMKVT